MRASAANPHAPLMPGGDRGLDRLLALLEDGNLAVVTVATLRDREIYASPQQSYTHRRPSYTIDHVPVHASGRPSIRYRLLTPASDRRHEIPAHGGLDR